MALQAASPLSSAHRVSGRRLMQAADGPSMGVQGAVEQSLSFKPPCGPAMTCLTAAGAKDIAAFPGPVVT